MGFSYVKNQIIPKVISSSGSNNVILSKNPSTSNECCNPEGQECCCINNNNNNSNSSSEHQKQVGTYLRILGDILTLTAENQNKCAVQEVLAENQENGG